MGAGRSRVEEADARLTVADRLPYRAGRLTRVRPPSGTLEVTEEECGGGASLEVWLRASLGTAFVGGNGGRPVVCQGVWPSGQVPHAGPGRELPRG